MAKCFFVCPVKDGTKGKSNSDKVMKHILQPVLTSLQIDIVQMDDLKNEARIDLSIEKHVLEDELCIFDLTEITLPCMYELGLRKGAKLPYIIIKSSRGGVKLPVEISAEKRIEYDFEADDPLDAIYNTREKLKSEANQLMREKEEDSEQGNTSLSMQSIEKSLQEIKRDLSKLLEKNSRSEKEDTDAIAENSGETKKVDTEEAEIAVEALENAVEESENSAVEAENVAEEPESAVEELKIASEGKKNTTEVKKNTAEGKKNLTERKKNVAEGKKKISEAKRSSSDGKKTSDSDTSAMEKPFRAALKQGKVETADEMLDTLQPKLDKWKFLDSYVEAAATRGSRKAATILMENAQDMMDHEGYSLQKKYKIVGSLVTYLNTTKEEKENADFVEDLCNQLLDKLAASEDNAEKKSISGGVYNQLSRLYFGIFQNHDDIDSIKKSYVYVCKATQINNDISYYYNKAIVEKSCWDLSADDKYLKAAYTSIKKVIAHDDKNGKTDTGHVQLGILLCSALGKTEEKNELLAKIAVG